MALFIGHLAISSTGISPLEPIPQRYSADGENTAPEISISQAPKGTVELAVICHDPDAPLPQGFTHWTVYGIAPADGELDLSVNRVREGPNGIGAKGWTGPQPPPGHGRHHYYFWVYALDKRVSNEPTREEFLETYADAIIEQARFVATFER